MQNMFYNLAQYQTLFIAKGVHFKPNIQKWRIVDVVFAYIWRDNVKVME